MIIHADAIPGFLCASILASRGKREQQHEPDQGGSCPGNAAYPRHRRDFACTADEKQARRKPFSFPLGAACIMPPVMELHGTIASNLEAAVASAGRLRGHPVYRETIEYWNELLHQARRARERGGVADDARLEMLISRLETELADRNRG